MRLTPTGAASATRTIRRRDRCLDTRLARDVQHTGLVDEGSARAGFLLQAAAVAVAPRAGEAAVPLGTVRLDFQRGPRQWAQKQPPQ